MERISHWESALTKLNSDCDFYCYDEVPSTMDVARDLVAQSFNKKPILVVAKEQTAGRGRLGRKWDATSRGFAGTFVFTTGDSISSLLGYSLVVGCAVVRVFEKHKISLRLKWPNDVFNNDEKKVGGILVEIIKSDNKVYVLTGIGLNLFCSADTISDSGSIFTKEMLESINNHDLEASLASELINVWHVFRKRGYQPFYPEWHSYALFLDKEVKIQSGSEIIQGKYKGTDDRGSLCVESRGTLVAYPSAQILEIGIEN